jgi:hypothetical protein
MLSNAERKRSQRERTAKHREKMKERSAAQVAAAEQRRYEEFNQWRKASCLVFPGERAPFIDADVPEALTVAREFLLALHQPDVLPRETLLSAERRVVKAWGEVGCPLLNRDTRRLDTSVASTGSYVFDFDNRWIALPGSDVPIDISTLPIIEVPEVEVLAVHTPEAPALDHANDPAFKNYRTPEVVAICKAQQDACAKEGRKISARNLERERQREKHLGVAYAYDVE